MQHTDHCVGRRSVAGEVPHTHVLHRRPEGRDVGAVEARLDTASDCSFVRSHHGSVRGIFERTGGFRPPQRSRSPIALTLAEREEISRSVAEGQSIRSTAARLGRAPSTVSREIGRNGGQGNYRATEADRAAWDRTLRPKCCKLASNRALAQIVTDKLRLLWSPEQIAGWLKHAHPHDENHRVSHETIYRTLFIQARGALKKELL